MYKLINYYTQRFSFPFRGWKYFNHLLKSWGINTKEYRKKISNGMFMRVNPSEHIQQQLFWYGYYERPVALLLEKIIRPDSIVLDVGANIGYFTLVSANRVKTGKVYAFEPVNELFDKLQKNIEENKLQNVETSDSAVGETEADGVIFVSDGHNIGMSSLKPPENFSGISQPVRIRSLDNWAMERKTQRIDIIKLDVEGSELFALIGMNKILMNLRPFLIIEINPATLAYFNVSPSDIMLYLDQRGYLPFKIAKDGLLRKITIPHGEENVVFIHSEKIEQFNSYLIE